MLYICVVFIISLYEEVVFVYRFLIRYGIVLARGAVGVGERGSGSRSFP
jgi:hypothetical protein